MSSSLLLIAADCAAIILLTLIYFRRHRRRDLVTAFLAVNVGVLAVTVALAGSAASVGLGLGLFGVLSIIRLRSTELGQHEIAYYFAALALGLLGGLGTADVTLALVLMALVTTGVLTADSTLLLGRYQQQTVVLDRAIADPATLTARLEQLLGARVDRVVVQELDLVDDSTTVDVRYAVEGHRSRRTRRHPAAAGIADRPSAPPVTSRPDLSGSASRSQTSSPVPATSRP